MCSDLRDLPYVQDQRNVVSAFHGHRHHHDLHTSPATCGDFITSHFWLDVPHPLQHLGDPKIPC